MTLFATLLAEQTKAPAADSLEGKVFCGYQGWFRAEGDSSGIGWVHYGPGKRFGPGTCGFDLWPDLSEFTAQERYSSPFRFEDGSTAELFSSANPATVRRHFRWMREYGIDGAFVQRFAVTMNDPRAQESLDAVLTSCTAAANAEGRSLTVMYDLSGFEAEQFWKVAEDWKALVAAGQTSQACTQKHEGKPFVAIWGLGFQDRPAAFAEWIRLVRAIRETGCSVMVGVPAFWREMKGDTVNDAALHEVIKLADVISPWTVGRCSDLEGVLRLGKTVWQPDEQWCVKENKFYLPVIFPGFSWHNLSAMRGNETPLNQIPREKGRLFWGQALEAKKAGAKALYIAMFDEIDEGTAVMKCGGRRPVGGSPFVDLSDVPSDHYLWLSGEVGRLLREELGFGPEMPER